MTISNESLVAIAAIITSITGIVTMIFIAVSSFYGRKLYRVEHQKHQNEKIKTAPQIQSYRCELLYENGPIMYRLRVTTPIKTVVLSANVFTRGQFFKKFKPAKRTFYTNWDRMNDIGNDRKIVEGNFTVHLVHQLDANETKPHPHEIQFGVRTSHGLALSGVFLFADLLSDLIERQKSQTSSQTTATSRKHDEDDKIDKQT